VPRKYRVELSPSAEADVRSAHDFIARDNPRAATRWANSIRRVTRSLNSFPERFETLPEGEEVASDYRQVLYGNYRIIYRVETKRVIVVRVIHAARLLIPAHLGLPSKPEA
jgi:plasmid stabilization system protein ParE